MIESEPLYLFLLLASVAGVAILVTYWISQKRMATLSDELQVQTEKNLDLIRKHSAELEKSNSEHREVIANYCQDAQKKLEEEYARGKRQGELDSEEKAKAFAVIVRPYVSQTKEGSFFKSYNLEIGYQYQLLVNGIPCFEPHVVIEQRTEEKEMNTELIEKVTEIAVNTAKKAVSNTPAGKLITVLDSLVLTKK